MSTTSGITESSSELSVMSESNTDNSLSTTASVSFEGELLAADEQVSDIYGGDFNPCLGILHSGGWSIASAVLVIISLYLQDFNLIFLPKDFDTFVTIIYVIITVIFLLEIFMLSLLQKKYFGVSIWFWADVFGFLSLVVDCIPISALGNAQPENSTNTVDNFVNSLRLLRLFRIWRLFKLLGLFTVYNNDKQGYAGVLGKGYATYASMKSGALVIVLCFLIANLSLDQQYSGPPMIAEMISEVQDPALISYLITTLEQSYPVFSVDKDGFTLYDNGNDEFEYRSVELEDFNINNVTIQIEVDEIVQANAAYNILSITLVLLAFLVIAYLIKKDAERKFTVKFREFLVRITKISKVMGVFESTDDLYARPDYFYQMLLDDISARVKKVEKAKKKNQ